MWVAFVFIPFCLHCAFNLNLAKPEIQSYGIIFVIFLKQNTDIGLMSHHLNKSVECHQQSRLQRYEGNSIYSFFTEKLCLIFSDF